MRHIDIAIEPTESALKIDTTAITPRRHDQSSGHMNRTNTSTVTTKTTHASPLKPVTGSSLPSNQGRGCSIDGNQQPLLKAPALSTSPDVCIVAAPIRSSHASIFAKIKPKTFSGVVEPRKSTSLRSATPPPSEPPTLTIETNVADSDANNKLAALAVDVRAGIAARVPPILVEDCTGGVYLLRTRAQRLAAVFKPADEEPYAPNNPKRFRPDLSACGGVTNSPPKPPAGIRAGIPPGQAAVREAAAYLVDHDTFAGVPATAIATTSHPAFCSVDGANLPKRGAFQTYVPHKCTADDISMSFFDTANVHAIAVLDIRLANQDRHGGNLLVVEEKTQLWGLARGGNSTAPHSLWLVPIDHGACLPVVTALSETSFAWLFWPQARQPFDARTLEYIQALDASADQDHLAEYLGASALEYQAVLTLHICTALLQVCALDWHMTAHEIGLIMCRQGTYRQRQPPPSVLELLVAKALRDAPVREVTAIGEEKLSRLETMALVSSFRGYLAEHLHATRPQ